MIPLPDIDPMSHPCPPFMWSQEQIDWIQRYASAYGAACAADALERAEAAIGHIPVTPDRVPDGVSDGYVIGYYDGRRAAMDAIRALKEAT